MPAYWTDLVQGNDPNLFSFTNPPDAWSVVYMGPNNQMLPGLLENGDIAWRKHPSRVIDRAKGPSQDGQNPKLLGIAPSEFDLPMVIWDETQLNLLNQMLPSIWPNKSTPGAAGIFAGIGVAPGNGIPGATSIVGLNLTPAALAQSGGQGVVQYDGPITIQHPALSMAGVTSVIVEGWTPPVRWQGKNDIKKYVIHCMEFRPAVKKTTSHPTVVKQPSVTHNVLPDATAQTSVAKLSSGPQPN